MMIQTGGQVTKLIIVVKMLGCKLLYIIQVKEFSWPYLISKILVAYNYSYNAASDWPHTFFTARLFLFRVAMYLLAKRKPILICNLLFTVCYLQ